MIAGDFWLFAGPNGAGKSTLAKSPEFSSLLAPQFLNPDDVCRALLIERGFRGFSDAPAEIQRQCSIAAANATFQEVETRIFQSGAVGVETVLSTDKYLQLARDAAQTHLIYIGNQSPEISIERVALRVRKGGHNVPETKIRARWHRSLEFCRSSGRCLIKPGSSITRICPNSSPINSTAKLSFSRLSRAIFCFKL